MDKKKTKKTKTKMTDYIVRIKRSGVIVYILVYIVKMKWLLVLLFTIGYSHADDTMWDELIDQAIDAAKQDLIDSHHDLITIPDFEEKLNEKILGIDFSIDVKIKGAQFWNVTSLKRKSHVTVLQDDTTGNITYAMALGLDVFKFQVNDLYVHVFGMTVSGKLDAQCGSNVLDFSISLIEDGDKCTASINWARITDFSKFNIQISPSGVVNWIAEHTASVILNDFSSKLINFINLHLVDQINSVLSQVDVCKYIDV